MRSAASSTCRTVLAVASALLFVDVNSAFAQAACCDPNTGTCTEVTTGLCDGVGPSCQSDAECGSGVCVPDCPTGSTAQGFGTNCTPNCCPQPVHTGADDCDDAVANFLSVDPNPNVTTTVTITGDNSTASLPDPCEFLFACPPCLFPSEPGWWEAFAIVDCANIRVDFCCSDPLRAFQWGLLSNDCPCSGGKTYSTPVAPPVGIPEDSGANGAPFCDDDNLWHTFGPLRPGRYSYPVFSATEASRGPYQMHVTAAACPTRACCLSAAMCVDDATGAVGVACANGQADCSAGSTCAFCTELNKFECEDVRGYWLGEGGVPTGEPPVTSCTSGRCDIGACCFVPGTCEDRRSPPDPCDPNNPSTCMTREQCLTDLGGRYFVPGVQCDNPAERCPACEIESPAHCQLRAGGEDYQLGTLSDLAVGQMAADDFVPQGDSIARLCITGQYVSQDPAAPTVKCADTAQVVEKFLVRVYANDPATNLPGTLIGERDATVTLRGLDLATAYLEWHKLQLELSSPINGLMPGQCHWLEVTNNTDETAIPDTINKCRFYWATHIPVGGAHEGNHYSAIAAAVPAPMSGPSPYVLGNHRTLDMVFCLDIPFDANGCGDIAGACCACDASVCADAQRLRTCNAQLRTWHGEDLDCADVTCSNDPPPGDTCDTDDDGTPDEAIVATDGLYVAHTQCANTDGPVGRTDIVLKNDLWYAYTATCTGTLTVSMCGSALSYDGFMAAYTNNADQRACRCPGSSGAGTTLWPPEYTSGSDEDCHRGFIGSGFLTGRVQKSDCILVRLGGYGGAAGDASLTIQCEPLICRRADAPTIVQHDSNPTATTSLVDLKMNRYLGIQIPPRLCLTNAF